jgi:hypothetical protein
MAGLKGYCMKERKKCSMTDTHITSSKTGQKLMKGKCGSCGTTVVKIHKPDNTPAIKRKPRVKLRDTPDGMPARTRETRESRTKRKVTMGRK